MLSFWELFVHACPLQTDQDATISFYGYAVAPLAGLADPALADGLPLLLPEIPITIVGSKPAASSSKKGNPTDTSGTATILIEARRIGSEGAVKAAEARERRLSQGPLSGSGIDLPVPSISVQSAVRASPYPGSATPPQLEEGHVNSLRLKHAERENARLKKEIALIKVRLYRCNAFSASGRTDASAAGRERKVEARTVRAVSRARIGGVADGGARAHAGGGGEEGH